MIVEVYYCVLSAALFFAALSFIMPGKILPPLLAGLMFAILSIASGSINVCGINNAVCDYSEPAMVYVWLILAIVMILLMITDVVKQAKGIDSDEH